MLKVQNLRIAFQNDGKSTLAADDLSFEIEKGETLGIVGESGSGKSVTALSIMRLLSPSAKVEAAGIWMEKDEEKTNILDLPKSVLTNWRGVKIGMIFQEPMTSLNPLFTCGNQVAEVLIYHQKQSKQAAKIATLALFEQVKLQEPERIFTAYPHQLSGGQKQRVMIAAAIACQPDLLIADEPTTALDVTVQRSILDLLKELQAKMDMSVLFITHDLEVLARIADRALVMQRGKIVERGTIQQLFTAAKHPYTKALLACRPPQKERWYRLPNMLDFLGEDEEKKNVAPIIISAEETAARLVQLQAQKPIIQVKDLSVKFPKKHNFFGQVKEYLRAVDEVSFNIFPGETLGLVGESGSGKTTLGRTLLLLNELESGSLKWENKNLTQLSDSQLINFRKEAQIIFQDPYSSLNPKQTIGASILEPMRVHQLYENDQIRLEKVYDLLETVQLEAAHFHRFPHEFSGGQRQRICIARALAVEPRFLVCDECVSALDVSVQAAILNLLMDLQESRNLTYLFISHDLSVVRFMSDRILVMKDGKIVERGAADAVYEAPQHPYTKRLMNT